MSSPALEDAPFTPEQRPLSKKNSSMLSISLLAGSSRAFGLDWGKSNQEQTVSNNETNLPPSLTVSYLINWRNDERHTSSSSSSHRRSGTDSIATNVSDDDITTALQRAGITWLSSDSARDRRAAYVKAFEDNGRFWQLHYSLHHNANRVRNWMMAHVKLREQLATLRTEEFKRAAVLFHRVEKKLESLEDFESTILFPFFSNEHIGDTAAIMDVMREHDGLSAVTQAVQSALDNNNEGALRTSLQVYADAVTEYLDQQEKLLVGMWLNLNEAEYKKYRSNLSWKYCLLY